MKSGDHMATTEIEQKLRLWFIKNFAAEEAKWIPLPEDKFELNLKKMQILNHEIGMHLLLNHDTQNQNFIPCLKLG